MPLTSSDPIASDPEDLALDESTEQRNSAIIARIRLRPQRRGCVRTAVSFPGSVIIGRARHEGFVTDLGIGGLFVQVDFVPTSGVRVGIEITHEGSTVRLPVVIRWIDSTGFGAQFESLTPAEALVVMTLLAEARNQDR